MPATFRKFLLFRGQTFSLSIATGAGSPGGGEGKGLLKAPFGLLKTPLQLPASRFELLPTPFQLPFSSS